MRSIVLTALALISSTGSAAESTSATPSCQLQSPGMDSRQLRCALPTVPTAQRFRLLVNFSGGHDDTKVSVMPTLNGAPLRCESGSKLQSMGEDGDLQLVCVFSAPTGDAANPVFGATFTWSHAEYVDYAFTSH